MIITDQKKTIYFRLKFSECFQEEKKTANKFSKEVEVIRPLHFQSSENVFPLMYAE